MNKYITHDVLFINRTHNAYRCDILRRLVDKNAIVELFHNMTFKNSLFYDIILNLIRPATGSSYNDGQIKQVSKSVNIILRIAEPIMSNRISPNIYDTFSDICINLCMWDDVKYYSYIGCISYPRASREHMICIRQYIHSFISTLDISDIRNINDPKFIKVKNIINDIYDENFINLHGYNLEDISFIATVRYITGDYENAIFYNNMIKYDNTHKRFNADRYHTINVIRLHSLYLLGRHDEVISERISSYLILIQAMSYLAIGQLDLCNISLVEYKHFLKSMPSYNIGEYGMQYVYGSGTFRIKINVPTIIHELYNEPTLQRKIQIQIQTQTQPQPQNQSTGRSRIVTPIYIF
jgi:hypothetical protein